MKDHPTSDRMPLRLKLGGIFAVVLTIAGMVLAIYSFEMGRQIRTYDVRASDGRDCLLVVRPNNVNGFGGDMELSCP